MRTQAPEVISGWRVVGPASEVFTLGSPPPPSAGEAEAARVARAATGPIDPGLLAELVSVDPAGLPDGARVDLIVAFERLRAHLDAAQQHALAAVVEATADTGVDGHLARHEVGAALRLSPGTAADRTRVAAELTGRLRATLTALTAGRISYLQARALADAVRELDDQTAAAVQTRVLARAGGQTLAETRASIRRAVVAADPAGAQDRHEQARAERRVSTEPLEDAMGGLWATMPAHQLDGVWASLTDHARAARAGLRTAGADDPGLDALRVDALVALITGNPLPGTSPAPAPAAEPGRPGAGDRAGDCSDPSDRSDWSDPAGEQAAADGAADAGAGAGAGAGGGGLVGLPRCRCGRRATAAVIVDLPTLMHLAERPGELPGYGPIPPGLARELAADADWVRWTTDPGTRRLIDIGADRYSPGDRLARHVIAAHRVCGFPGCNRPADRCDLDHVVEFRTRGGKTILVNLGPLCRQHHNAKTHAGWRYDYDHTTGVKTWTSPLGKTYRKGPTRYPPEGDDPDPPGESASHPRCEINLESPDGTGPDPADELGAGSSDG